MRIGGHLLAAAASLSLGSCAASGEAIKACHDAVKVYFTRGIDQLGLDALNKTLLAVSTLEACPNAKAVVTGHIDGTEIGMPRLGMTRAANVSSVMIKRGVDRRRITIRDAEFRQPARPTAPGIGDAKNRFVAIEWQ